jgi:hypothetical protein
MTEILYVDHLNAMANVSQSGSLLGRNVTCANGTKMSCILEWLRSISTLNCKEGIWHGISEGARLPENYVSHFGELVDQLLLLAGLRTAHLLEDAYRQKQP